MARRKQSPRGKKQQSRDAPGWGIGWRIVATVALVALVLAIYWALQQSNHLAVRFWPFIAEKAMVETATDSATETANTGQAQPPVGPLEGFTAPDFTLTSLTGEPVALSDYRGRPVFVTFFHSW